MTTRLVKRYMGETTEEQFHQMLDRTPNDHQTRQVFADWLDERGDPRAAGYRALGVLGKHPEKDGGYHWWYGTHYPVLEGNHLPHTVLPEDWARIIRDDATWHPEADNDIKAHYDRRDAEDAAAVAFSQLPPERQHEIMNPAPPAPPPEHGHMPGEVLSGSHQLSRRVGVHRYAETGGYTHADFLRKIAENPAETTPALVYADWLDENGHSELAHVIRGHVEAHGNGGDPAAWVGPEVRAGAVGLHGGQHGHNDWRVRATMHVPGGVMWRMNPQSTPTHHEGGGIEWVSPTSGEPEATFVARGLLAKGAHPYGGSYWQPEWMGRMGSYTQEHERTPYPTTTETPTQMSRSRRAVVRYSHEAFLKPIVEGHDVHGTDEVSPMVYADWLEEEQNRPNHAAFIRRAMTAGHAYRQFVTYSPGSGSGADFDVNGWQHDSPGHVNLDLSSQHVVPGVNNEGEPFNRRVVWHLNAVPHEEAEHLVAGLKSEGAHIDGTAQLLGLDEPDPTLGGPQEMSEDTHTGLHQMSRRVGVRRYAAYRAPTGGMVVRGSHYKGGEMVPDMEGAFANPPVKMAEGEPAPGPQPGTAPPAPKKPSRFHDVIKGLLKVAGKSVLSGAIGAATGFPVHLSRRVNIRYAAGKGQTPVPSGEPHVKVVRPHTDIFGNKLPGHEVVTYTIDKHGLWGSPMWSLHTADVYPEGHPYLQGAIGHEAAKRFGVGHNLPVSETHRLVAEAANKAPRPGIKIGAVTSNDPEETFVTHVEQPPAPTATPAPTPSPAAPAPTKQPLMLPPRRALTTPTPPRVQAPRTVKLPPRPKPALPQWAETEADRVPWDKKSPPPGGTGPVKKQEGFGGTAPEVVYTPESPPESGKASRRVRMGRAPADEVSGIAQGQEAYGGAYDPNNQSDMILADKLADHNDPLETVVRRDMSYRPAMRADWGDFFPKLQDHVDYLAASPVRLRERGDPLYHIAPDGGEIHVHRYGDDGTGNAIAYRVNWAPKVRHAVYAAAMTPEETIHLLNEHGVQHDLKLPNQPEPNTTGHMTGPVSGTTRGVVPGKMSRRVACRECVGGQAS